MDHILNQLYEYFYQPTSLTRKQVKALCDEYLPMLQEVQDAFGLKFTDRFTLLKAQLEHCGGEASFVQGFRVAAQLMLEILAPLTSANS